MFGIAVFIGSLLLFMVEPMAAKVILTRFGGSAAVWTASLLFFQLMLLAGYGWAHYGSRLFGKAHRWVHVGLSLAGAGWVLFGFGVQFGMVDTEASTIQVLVALTGMVGLPFFALSANASLLQNWFARKSGKEPYFLYSASNLGSMLALLAYPLLVEPLVGLRAQLKGWGMAYFGLVALLGYCAWDSRQQDADDGQPRAESAISWPTRWQWILLSAAPSSLLIGVTTYLTTNIAPVPLLWVVPLALYLLTFILAFGRRVIAPEKVGRWAPLLATPLALCLILESSEPIIPLASFHLGTFFVVTLACHTRLSSLRPEASAVTEYFLYVAIGGAIGGIFNALIAPILFTTLFEYPLALAVGCGLVVAAGKQEKPKAVWTAPALGVAAFAVAVVCALIAQRSGMAPTPMRTLLTIGVPAVACFLLSGHAPSFGWALGGLFLGANLMQVASDGSLILAERSFFGVHRVVFLAKQNQRRLVHGNTTHGIESLTNLDEPLTYYSRTGPLGEVFKRYPFDHASIGLVGLGVGSIAAYGKPGQTMTYYEIDPVVRKVAGNRALFTFLADSKAAMKVVAGDGRLGVSKAPDHEFNLLVLDAFSSDSIPVHLITRDAMELYLRKLAPHGLVCYHISNRYLELAPVLAAEARDLGLVALMEEDSMVDPDEQARGKTASKWLVLARTAADLKPLADHSDFLPVTPAAKSWTDDYSNVLGAFKLHD